MLYDNNIDSYNNTCNYYNIIKCNSEILSGAYLAAALIWFQKAVSDLGTLTSTMHPSLSILMPPDSPLASIELDWCEREVEIGAWDIMFWILAESGASE